MCTHTYVCVHAHPMNINLLFMTLPPCLKNINGETRVSLLGWLSAAFITTHSNFMLLQERGGNSIQLINSHNTTLAYIPCHQAVPSALPETSCLHKCSNHTWHGFGDGDCGGD